MDQRAQISVEYILLVAVIILIVLVFAVIITDQNEQNNVASAVQLGATNATANLIFSNTGQSPVKVTSVSMTNGTNINMTIHFSRSVTGQESVIIDSITKSLNSAGYTNTSKTTNSVTLTTSTGVSVRHTYFITLA